MLKITSNFLAPLPNPNPNPALPTLPLGKYPPTAGVPPPTRGHLPWAGSGYTTWKAPSRTGCWPPTGATTSSHPKPSPATLNKSGQLTRGLIGTKPKHWRVYWDEGACIGQRCLFLFWFHWIDFNVNHVILGCCI